MAESLNLNSVIDEIVASPADARAAAADAQVDFCEYWPNVKRGLELLAKLYPKAKIVIAIVIAIGDRVCPG